MYVIRWLSPLKKIHDFSGEPLRYDPDFNGPIRNRSCTDVLWLIVFILFLGVWGYVGFYGTLRLLIHILWAQRTNFSNAWFRFTGIKNGNVEKLLAPLDSRGKRCGLDSELEDKKYLVFFNIAKCLSPTTAITGCNTPQVTNWKYNTCNFFGRIKVF